MRVIHAERQPDSQHLGFFQQGERRVDAHRLAAVELQNMVDSGHKINRAVPVPVLVLGDRHDYEWARDFVRRHNLATRCHAVLFSPVFGALPAKEVGEWIVSDGLPVRVQVQLHKILGMK